MKKILMLAANPRNDLSLDREIRDLQGAIAKSPGQEFVVEKELAVRVEDLQDLMLRHRPQIVHFCGHGEGDEGLVFDSDRGLERRLRTDALSDLFRLCAQTFTCNCVLLNACYSEAQADAIVNHIDYVIGMRQTIRDNAAIAFATGFYRALGYDCTIEQAYEFGCNAIQLEISGSSIVRSSVTDQQRKLIVEGAIASTPIPEHLKPILKKRVALDSKQEPAVSQTTQAEIRLDIDKSLEADSKTKQYRDRVREYLGDRVLSPVEKIRLGQLRRDLKLTEAEAEQILAEELAPIQKALDDYAEILTALITEGHYPFDETTQGELQQFQRELQLTDAEAKALLDKAEKDYQEKQEQERERILQRFQQTHSFVEDLGNGVVLEMVAIPAGEFLMGTAESSCHSLIQEYFRYQVPQGDAQRWIGWEMPQHQVRLIEFYISKFPIAQAQFVAIMGSNPSYFKGEKLPVESVSWEEAIEFCHRLSKKTGKLYRLPSEAEWEYTCRAGTNSSFYFGETITYDLVNCNFKQPYDNVHEDIHRAKTVDIDSFPPNAFSVHDLHENVWEWCLDHWHENYENAPNNSKAWVVGGDSSKRVLRGGSWISFPRDCRSASRNWHKARIRGSGIGFRVACSVMRTP